MTEKPWIIDVWVSLLQPAADVPGSGDGEGFGRYGQLEALREGTKPEQLVAEMDAAEGELVGRCGTAAAWVTETCARYPGRLFGMVSPDPRGSPASPRIASTSGSASARESSTCRAAPYRIRVFRLEEAAGPEEQA